VAEPACHGYNTTALSLISNSSPLQKVKSCLEGRSVGDEG
jgi:hypothetical protein